MKPIKPLVSSFYRKANAFLQQNILGLILLGIFTSALYDVAKGTPGIFINAILRTFTFLFRSYVEQIHQPIGEARSDQLVKTIYTLLISSSITVTCMLIIKAITNVKSGYKQAEEIKLKANKLANLTANIKTLEDQAASVEAMEDKSIEEVEDLKKKLAAVKEERQHFLALEDKAKSVSDLVEESEDAITKLIRLKRQIYYVSMFMVLIFAYFATMFVGELYTRDAAIFVDRSIEILAPTIPPEKVLQLRAKYRSVDSAQKFYELHDELQTIAKEKNVTLPKFTVIKR